MLSQLKSTTQEASDPVSVGRTAWGKAKHQVFVLKPEILELIGQGENLEGIYQQLTAQNKLNIGKRTFKRHAAAIRRAELVRTDLVWHPPSSSPPVIQEHKPAPVIRTFVPPSSSKVTFDHSPIASEDAIAGIWGDDTLEDEQHALGQEKANA
jgi:hypothetical protein